MAKNGLMVVEDIANIEAAYYLRDFIGSGEIFDLRNKKNRSDDIMLVINLS